jgi:pimeloyl-ACP methyl ester carboxylesterase
MIETNDYIYINGFKIEIKVISHKSNLEPIIFLHEGLGSIALWKDFPLRVAKATGRDIILYSRIGMGKSSPIQENRKLSYMHDEAKIYLPQIIKYFNLPEVILFGHSDGASIALIYAGSGFKVKSLILEAPHVFVENISIKGIKIAEKAWNNNNLKDKLSKYHEDVEGAFNGWCNVWLSKGFKNWNIEDYLKSITVPIQLIQGSNDEYGSLKQLESIEKNVSGRTYRHEIEDCGHSPHSQYPIEITNKIKYFLSNN